MRAGRQPAGGSLPIVDNQRVGLDAAGVQGERDATVTQARISVCGVVERLVSTTSGPRSRRNTSARSTSPVVACIGNISSKRGQPRLAVANAAKVVNQALLAHATEGTPVASTRVNKSMLSLLDDGAKTDGRGAPVERHRSFGAGAVGLLRGSAGSTSGLDAAGIDLQRGYCADGQAPACGALGRSLVTHVTSEKDIGRGVVLLESSCADGDAASCLTLGGLYRRRRQRQGVRAGHQIS